MGQLIVEPGSLESVAALLRGAHDHGVTMLARAVVGDVRCGIGGTVNGDRRDVFSEVRPRVTEFVREQTKAISVHLDGAAAAYRRAEWLVRVALAEQS